MVGVNVGKTMGVDVNVGEAIGVDVNVGEAVGRDCVCMINCGGLAPSFEE
jgi:hypothetical protein